jgi:hypothetical protein
VHVGKWPLIQINPHNEHLRPENSYRHRVRVDTTHILRKAISVPGRPSLARTGGSAPFTSMLAPRAARLVSVLEISSDGNSLSTISSNYLFKLSLDKREFAATIHANLM